jgi:DNA repair exonuclease SbcCD ATPase subunit
MEELQDNELSQLKAEVILLTGQMATNILEIGKRLSAIRGKIEHGNWDSWVEENLPFSRRWANQYIKAFETFGNSSSQLPAKKMFLLLDLPQEQREEFIQSNPVEEMTTRELQSAIKAQKEAEAEVQRLNKELSKPKEPVIIEKEVLPLDYQKAKVDLREKERNLQQKEQEIKRLQEDKELLERKAKLNEREAKEHRQLKDELEKLKRDKSSLYRQIRSATELSGLVVKVENFLKTELAPIKYSRAIQEQRTDEIVVKNLAEIVERIEDWCKEMRGLMPSNDYVEVFECERSDTSN